MDEQSLSSSEINEAVARKLGWKYAEPWHGKNELPDYCHSIEAAWEITPHLDFKTFDHWPTPEEICLAFLKLKKETR